MLVTQCSVCETKIELQVGKTCEEAKCVNSVQQHLTAWKANCTIIETRVNHIKRKRRVRKVLDLILHMYSFFELSRNVH
jgi:hypothetical protein